MQPVCIFSAKSTVRQWLQVVQVNRASIDDWSLPVYTSYTLHWNSLKRPQTMPDIAGSNKKAKLMQREAHDSRGI